MIQLLHRCRMLSLLLLCFIATAFAQDDLQARKDSLRLALTQMQGPEKIDTYSRLATCYMMEVEDNLKMDTLFTLYEEMYEEAVMQGDFKSCGISMERRVSAYFNIRKYNEVFKQAPDWMDFLAKHEEWSNYYLIVNTLVMSYTLMSESDNALNLAQEMYEQAKQQQYNAGIGIMLQSIGFIYLMQDRPEESENFFRQSIELLKKEKDQVSFLLRTYLYLTQPLRLLKRYNEALSVCAEYEQAIQRDDFHSKNPTSWVNLYATYTDLYVALCDYDLAEVYCDKTDSISNVATSRIKTYRVRANIFNEREQYTEALEMVDKAMALLHGGKATVKGDLMMTKIEILTNMKQADDIYYLFWDYINLNDSIRTVEYNANLDELRTVYEVDKLTAEKEKTRNYLLFSLAVCLLLAIALGIWIYLHRQIARKNRALYSRIQELTQKEKEAEKQLLEAPEEELSRSMQIFRSLSKLMQKEKLFTDPDLKRKKLADLLHTNESYLADAIREATGETFSVYLSNLRLQYSIELLNESPDMTLESVSSDSGHGSYASFFRLFIKKYGITPSEYRKLSAAKLKK